MTADDVARQLDEFYEQMVRKFWSDILAAEERDRFVVDVAGTERMLAEARIVFELWRDEAIRRLVRDGSNANLNDDMPTWPTLPAGSSPWERVEDDED